MSGSKVLLIPHSPISAHNISRPLEMARLFASRGVDTLVLNWTLGRPSHGAMRKLAVRGAELARSATLARHIQPREQFHLVTLPYLLQPSGLAQRFNEKNIGRLVREANITHIVSQNAYHFPLPSPKRFSGRMIYDVVDDHVSMNSGPAWQKTRTFTLRELSKASAIITISHSLHRLLAAEEFQAQVIPNGVNCRLYRQIAAADIDTLRERLGLRGKRVITYIGNHGWWGDIPFLLQAFEALRSRRDDVSLVIVGPVRDGGDYSVVPRDVQFVGAIPSTEIHAYYGLGAAGVLPFKLCPFTHNALPLKVMEYGAARKPVVASPLNELATIGFPHVTLVELNKELWVDALQRAIDTPRWEATWDVFIDRYEWQNVLEPLMKLLH